MNFCERRVGEVINMKRCEFVGANESFTPAFCIGAKEPKKCLKEFLSDIVPIRV
jgi:hypothetical protein